MWILGLKGLIFPTLHEGKIILPGLAFPGFFFNSCVCSFLDEGEKVNGLTAWFA